jgi:hypothetical protein
MATMRKCHESRARRNKRRPFPFLAEFQRLCEIGSFLISILLFTPPERIKLIRPNIQILIMMDWMRVAPNLGPKWQLQTARQSHTILINHTLEHTPANESPQTHALTQRAIQTDHTRKAGFSPGAVLGSEFGAHFSAHGGQVGWAEGRGGEIKD